MIQLTRLNNQPLTVNSDLIKFVENTPDTVLTLVTGEKIVVLESSKQVVDKIVEFRKRVLTDLPVQDISSSSQAGRMTRQLFPVEKS
jgi:flagellar protein FlbD